MKITAIRSDELYKKMITASEEEKKEIYRNQLMKPFEFKWQCLGVPLKAEVPGGYDVVTAAEMSGGYTPTAITEDRSEEIERISDNKFWAACEKSIADSLNGFEKSGIILPKQDYVFTILLNNPQHPMSAMTGDYCGDGGIPGFITGTIIPNEKSLEMMPVALAHETNHNVRWQFMQWSPQITLADMIVSEGLAESFAAFLFGEEKVGKWVTTTSKETLEEVIKPMMKEHLLENDFTKLSSFLYGDEIMTMRGAEAIGMPYCGGYACGYALVQYYLKKTGRSIYEATITSTQDILHEVEDFWE